MTNTIQKNITKESSKKVEKKYREILMSGNYLPDDDHELNIAPYIEGVMPYDEGFLQRVEWKSEQIPPEAIATWKSEKAEKEEFVASIPTDIREAVEFLYDFYADMDGWRELNNDVHGMNTYEDLILGAIVPCPISAAILEEEDTDDEDREDEDQFISHVYRRYDDAHVELLKKDLAMIKEYAKTHSEFNEYRTGITLRGIAFLSDLLSNCEK